MMTDVVYLLMGPTPMRGLQAPARWVAEGVFYRWPRAGDRCGEPQRPLAMSRSTVSEYVSMSSAFRRKGVGHAAQMLIASLIAIFSRTRRSGPSSLVQFSN